jgi:hypothetical protein
MTKSTGARYFLVGRAGASRKSRVVVLDGLPGEVFQFRTQYSGLFPIAKRTFGSEIGRIVFGGFREYL